MANSSDEIELDLIMKMNGRGVMKTSEHLQANNVIIERAGIENTSSLKLVQGLV